MADALENMTEARAARRFHQMARTERAIVLKVSEIADCKAHLKELTEAYVGLVEALRTAARDEGELPLFADLDG